MIEASDGRVIAAYTGPRPSTFQEAEAIAMTMMESDELKDIDGVPHALGCVLMDVTDPNFITELHYFPSVPKGKLS